ncbi:protease [Leptospira wolffii]|uniref:Protease n=1 Tax=Leptospira wolffii TaxID=409998 RepID=A0A2M9ZDJ3_9LEPT|nr:DJ-1 family glyoxalase III [Leptospira wolffii]PJZ66486.1 protease [Leptospira wolffii]
MSKVLIPFANGMEEMEAVILVDVLRRAGIEVVSAGLSQGPVTSSRGVRILPDVLLSEIDPYDFDMILLPGGKTGTQNLKENPVLGEILLKFSEEKRWVGAICASPGVLLHHNILNESVPFTAFPGSVPKTPNYTGNRIEISGKILTSIGPGSAFEFALKIVQILVGTDKEKEVRAGLYLPE